MAHSSVEQKVYTTVAICTSSECTYPGTRPVGDTCPRCGQVMTVTVSSDELP